LQFRGSKKIDQYGQIIDLYVSARRDTRSSALARWKVDAPKFSISAPSARASRTRPRRGATANRRRPAAPFPPARRPRHGPRC